MRVPWGFTVGAFLCLALWPLWSARFPPMQDYPQHLAQAQIFGARNDPSFDCSRYFEFHLRPVYATFYLATLLFSRFVPVETAGKLALSLYPILVAAVVVRLGRRAARDAPPWGALLFFPMAFNQQYFMGNANYLLSLPLLMLALLDYEDLLRAPRGAWPVVRQCLWQAALAVTHPFTFLVYVALAGVASILLRRQAVAAWSKLLAPLGLAVSLVVACWIESISGSLPEPQPAGGMHWLPLKDSLQFFALLFTGMQWVDGVPLLPVLLWVAMIGLLLWAATRQRKEHSAFSPLASVWLAAACFGFLALPGGIGNYTGINLRVASIIYFLLALVAGPVRLTGWVRYSFVLLAALCMLDSVARQARVSAETGEVAPLLQQIPPNSRVLPLVFDRSSAALDRTWFETHLHDHNYYHVLRGGGFTPYLPLAQLNPVRYRPEQKRPAPGEYFPGAFRWELHAADYQYFLVRGAGGGFAEYLEPVCDLAAVSGRWTLFERKAAAGSRPTQLPKPAAQSH